MVNGVWRSRIHRKEALPLRVWMRLVTGSDDVPPDIMKEVPRYFIISRPQTVVRWAIILREISNLPLSGI